MTSRNAGKPGSCKKVNPRSSAICSVARVVGSVALAAGRVTLAVASVVLAAGCAAPAPQMAAVEQDAVGQDAVEQDAVAQDWSGFGDLENVLNWTPEQQLRGYRNIDKIFPTRPVRRGDDPYSLPSRPLDWSSLSYDVGGQRFDLDGFIEHNHVVGVLVIHGGDVVLERYARGNGPETRWYSFSVAKSVVSMLIGAAIRDGYIESLDAPVTDYLPLLRGSAYEGVAIRHALQMASGVQWDEDYDDPTSDVASTGGSALDRLRYLRNKPRVAPPGELFNYNTGETNLLGAVLRAAIGNNLSTYLEHEIWRPFGMEHDANWLLLSAGGGEHGGCCLSATLRDYGRIGLFALREGELRDGGLRDGELRDGALREGELRDGELREGGLSDGELPDGELPDGDKVLPDGWMTASTTPSPANQRYGYLWWLRDDGAYSAIGIYGQAIHIDPRRNLVIVTHGAWPHATDRAFSRHRTAFFQAVSEALSR